MWQHTKRVPNSDRCTVFCYSFNTISWKFSPPWLNSYRGVEISFVIFLIYYAADNDGIFHSTICLAILCEMTLANYLLSFQVFKYNQFFWLLIFSSIKSQRMSKYFMIFYRILVGWRSHYLLNVKLLFSRKVCKSTIYPMTLFHLRWSPQYLIDRCVYLYSDILSTTPLSHDKYFS